MGSCQPLTSLTQVKLWPFMATDGPSTHASCNPLSENVDRSSRYVHSIMFVHRQITPIKVYVSKYHILFFTLHFHQTFFLKSKSFFQIGNDELVITHKLELNMQNHSYIRYYLLNTPFPSKWPHMAMRNLMIYQKRCSNLGNFPHIPLFLFLNYMHIFNTISLIY